MNSTAKQLELIDPYPSGFWYWLNNNREIYREFENRALRMARIGRNRYSAKTIVEVMRWETDLREKNNLFKINNNYTAGMARLWMATHGETYPKFFQLRD